MAGRINFMIEIHKNWAWRTDFCLTKAKYQIIFWQVWQRLSVRPSVGKVRRPLDSRESSRRSRQDVRLRWCGAFSWTVYAWLYNGWKWIRLSNQSLSRDLICRVAVCGPELSPEMLNGIWRHCKTSFGIFSKVHLLCLNISTASLLTFLAGFTLINFNPTTRCTTVL